MKIKYPTINEIRFVAYELARELLSFDEPIPDFSTRFPDALERSLGSLGQTFNKKDLYPTFLDKASIFFYFMIKNHPFENGNKRIAVMSLLYFLGQNKKWINVDTQVLYNFAKWVAASDPNVKEAVVSAIKMFLRDNLKSVV